jgi:hypothetical protein
MEQEKDKTSRKKFVLWGFGILSSLTALKFMSFSKKKKKETVKMLTQEGRLVEIDKDMIPDSKRKITDPELKAWVKK